MTLQLILCVGGEGSGDGNQSRTIGGTAATTKFGETDIEPPPRAFFCHVPDSFAAATATAAAAAAAACPTQLFLSHLNSGGLTFALAQLEGM